MTHGRESGRVSRSEQFFGMTKSYACVGFSAREKLRPRQARYPHLIVQGSCRDRPLDPMNFTYSVAIGDPSVMRDQVRVGVKIKANTRRPARHRIQAGVGN